MKQWVVIDNNLMEKTWPNVERELTLDDVTIHLKDERIAEILGDDLDIHIFDADHSTLTLSELKRFVTIPHLRDYWANYVSWTTELQCYRAGTRHLIAHLKLKEEKRTENQALLSWRIAKLDASTGEIKALARKLLEYDLSIILVNLDVN
ncbi:hypothetical protein IKF57_00470 [Candidatus Saccharibacteria bacterium]|nr:hypothetical protein [Candidatus Saccharibacteria bacterium]